MICEANVVEENRKPAYSKLGNKCIYVLTCSIVMHLWSSSLAGLPKGRTKRQRHCHSHCQQPSAADLTRHGCAKFGLDLHHGNKAPECCGISGIGIAATGEAYSISLDTVLDINCCRLIPFRTLTNPVSR